MKWPRSWRQRGIFIQGWCFSILISWYGSASNHDIQGSPQISSRDIGYVLRILGQNPTEDEIVEMVMKVKLLDGPSSLRPTLDNHCFFLRLPPLSLILLHIASTVSKMSKMSTMMTMMMMMMTMTMVMTRQTVSGTGWWQEATFLPLASTFSSERRMQTTKYKMWSAKCKMPNIKYKMQYAKYRIQFKEEAKIQNANDDDHDNC